MARRAPDKASIASRAWSRKTSSGSRAYQAAEWDLLTRLPGRVLVAASAVGPAERLLAGLAAIAAGRAYDSDLTRAVVSSIYAERATPAPAGHPVLDDCRRATGILGARADPGDSAAYRQWVQLIAARACRPAATELERRFLADVRAALAL